MESSSPSDVDVLDDLLRDVDGEDDLALQEPAPMGYFSPLSSDVVVQAVLDLASSADNEDASERSRETNENEAAIPTEEEQLKSSQKLIQNEEKVVNDAEEHELPVQVEARDDEADTEVDESLDVAVVSTPNTDFGQNEAMDTEVESPEMLPPPQVQEEVNEALKIALPPPAPTCVPVIVGSINTVEDDNDDSDDSQDEDEGETSQLRPPLQLGGPEDDDEDVLEVDATVIGSLHIEEKERGSKEESSSDADKNALLKAPPSSKDDGPSAIDLSFSGEVCVAHVATLEPGSPFSDIHRIAGGSNAGKLLSDATFGISYQSLRKKMDEPGADEDEGKYTLPSGPAFPDEREFEKEMELTSDVSFSVATTGASPSKTIGTAEDDEFAFDVNLENDLSVLSEVSIKARRESLEVKKRKEEEELLKELKRATDEEKKLNESDQAMDSTQPDATAYKDADALSLAELHSIYKRGLGDQEVLMDEEKKNSTEAESSRSSVMGRIFSPISGKTETIIEEADDEDSEGEEKAHNDGREASVACDNAPDTKATSEKRDVDESAEWREIKLVQHRQSQSANAGDSPETAIVSYTEAAKYYAETPDVMQHRDIIVSEDFSRGSCMKCLSRPRLTFPGAIDERDRVFCIAATAFDAHNEIVVGILQTIYKKLTKNTRDVLLIGRHWEDIGFQGSDPSTDLRGCGVLSLLQILNLVETFRDLALRFHALSQHPTRHFPFACVLINITLQCVVALRSGALYPECNKQSSVLVGMNRMYVALASQLHDAIQSRSDEIPVVLKDILDRGRSNPIKVIGEAFDGDSLRPSRPAEVIVPFKLKASDRKVLDNNLEFTEIGLQAVDEKE
ncbi:ELMO/CED-12 family [Phytophthora infestans]|uniref:ELMO/CED-12 family n=1 Tax=Phytophthora infestans TaxID=4787 RepID=A0A8S9TI50_PHYIN|nr:ELMO/CED-12 family [Phytophthora infestans]